MLVFTGMLMYAADSRQMTCIDGGQQGVPAAAPQAQAAILKKASLCQQHARRGAMASAGPGTDPCPWSRQQELWTASVSRDLRVRFQHPALFVNFWGTADCLGPDEHDGKWSG